MTPQEHLSGQQRRYEATFGTAADWPSLESARAAHAYHVAARRRAADAATRRAHHLARLLAGEATETERLDDLCDRADEVRRLVGAARAERDLAHAAAHCMLAWAALSTATADDEPIPYTVVEAVPA